MSNPPQPIKPTWSEHSIHFQLFSKNDVWKLSLYKKTLSQKCYWSVFMPFPLLIHITFRWVILKRSLKNNDNILIKVMLSMLHINIRINILRNSIYHKNNFYVLYLRWLMFVNLKQLCVFVIFILYLRFIGSSSY